MNAIVLTAIVMEYNAHGTSQVEGGVPGMGVLIDNRPRCARAGAARKRAAPSPWLSAGGKNDFRLVDFSVRTVPVAGMARLCPQRTEAAVPLSVSVRDGHVSVSAGFARLADSSTARIRPVFAGFPRCSIRQATSR